jgi:quercetin dioxygenase-like cupin family protein
MRPGLFAFSVMACLVASAAMAQDPVKVDPDPKHYKVEYEDDQVRVLRIHLDPKETSPMHNHPPTIVISQSDVRLRFTYPDGKTEERTTTFGAVRHRPAVSHAAENLSEKPFDAIEVELKAKPEASKPAAEKQEK